MSLFEVPGWSVKAAPVREESQQVSKKRKRPSNHKQLESTEVNVEKLMAKLANEHFEVTRSPESKTRKKIYRQKEASTTGAEKTRFQPATLSRIAARSKHSTPSDRVVDTAIKSAKSKPKKKVPSANRKHTPASPSMQPSLPMPATNVQWTQKISNLTALQKSMKESLDGARFRFINENLYKTDSHQAHEMMRTDPKIFEEYHTGFRHQVVSWPINPVEHFASMFESYPQKTIIADLGCGDAALARKLVIKGISVISFDLVSDSEYVVEADICHKIPLPGSEECGKPKSTGVGQVVDVVVCALSLMGVNWPKCIREAWRILKAGGELHIAEVTSRFTDIEEFQSLLVSIGFRLKSKNDSISSHFIIFEFTKVPRAIKTEREWAKLLSKGATLKPCEYKRR